MNMKPYCHFDELPIIDIVPSGWLRAYLEKQMRGLTGHLDECGHPTFKLTNWNTLQPAANDVENWWPQEQSAYWIDGLLRCALLLGDQPKIDKARHFLNQVLETPDDDGYLGPAHLKFPISPIKTPRWPHAVFFRAFAADYMATNDERIPDALKKHYLSNTSPHNRSREVVNVEMMLWAYEKTGRPELLEAVSKAYQEFNLGNEGELDVLQETMLSDRPIKMHGVSFNEMAKLGAILYLYTGNETLLRATVNAYKKVERDQLLIDGVHSSAENLSGKEPLDSHEACNISDYTWSLGYLLMATGQAAYADKIERAMFNAAPGTVTQDFRAHQYFSCPNQVIAADSSDHNLNSRGGDLMRYRPYHHAPCCTGNINRAMPNYVARMWMVDAKSNGVAAVFYGPSQVNFVAGTSGLPVTIVEETEYPFSEQINFRILADHPVEFSLLLRIPGWCEAAEIYLNNVRQDIELRPSSFITISRTFQPNDCIRLMLPMVVKLSHWAQSGAGVERGPLVYSLPIEEQRVDLPNMPDYGAGFPVFNLFPASSWNYALLLNEKGELDSVEVIHADDHGDPFDRFGTPLKLRLKVRKVKGWDLIRTDVVEHPALDVEYYLETGKERFTTGVYHGDFTLTPALPDSGAIEDALADEIEQITLVPYGCTSLRMTIFPTC